MGVRIALVIGGQNMMAQAAALAKKPHIVIATPGRLRHHLEGADPPNLSKALYLVLDEADRLLSAGFSSELKAIISSMHPKRQTLLFSATLTDSLVELEKLAATDTLRFDLTSEASKVPSRLLQQYLFMPAQVKMCYLVAVLRKLFAAAAERAEDKSDNDDLGISAAAALNEKKGKPKKGKKGKDKGPKLDQSAKLLDYSIIIFVGTCRRCQEISETLQQLGIGCVALHGMLAQSKRMDSLDAFKSHRSRILVATDVASRGLDIPAVDLVINMDLPKIVADYVHRVGRTARAGRGGRALSLVTQYDVELVHAVEEYMGQKLTQSTEVVDDDVVPLLNSVSKAMRMAQLRLLEGGFDEKEEVILKRKKKQKRQLLRKAMKPESS
jgi:ATP-dependent RNA helicase DDX49/DBP8